MRLDPDFSEFIALLLDHEVAFLVVGGYAVAAHGHPRYTGDLDLWILVDRTNAERLIEALNAFGFGSLGLSADDFLVRDQVVQLGREPIRIDLLTGLDGVQFNECASRSVNVEVDGMNVPFISRANLLANKRASGRAQTSLTSRRSMRRPDSQRLQVRRAWQDG